MIRLASLVALGALAASPAFAWTFQPSPAPHFSSAFFLDSPKMAAFAADDVRTNPIRDQPADGQVKKETVKLPKGRAADHINISDPNDNPFMAAPLKDDSQPAPKDQAKANPAPSH